MVYIVTFSLNLYLVKNLKALEILTIKYKTTPSIIVQTQNSGNNKFWQKCGATGIPIIVD